MTPLFVGLDTGLTSTKAAVFADDGTVVASAAASTPQSSPVGERRERDPWKHWRSAAAVLARVMSDSAVKSHKVAGLGLTGHGDGLCLVDSSNRPLHPEVLSSDRRSVPILERWSAEDRFSQAQALGGATPFAGSPAPLLKWFLDNEPAVFASASWMMSAKDWLRLCLTGQVASDPTDAPSSFFSVDSWNYSDELLELYEVGAIQPLLPPVQPSTAPAGEVTAEAEAATGVPIGTPVVTGLHDVVASHLGAAGQQTGHAAIIAGTFGVDLTLVDHPVRSPSATCRPGAQLGQWTLRRTSLASGANVVWAVERLTDHRAPSPDVIGAAIEMALSGTPPADQPTYLPYLFGGSSDAPAAASFHGLRSTHTGMDLLRAVLYGVTFNHRLDLERLRAVSGVSAVHLTGGAARSLQWSQLFADVLGQSIQLSSTHQSAALGAAACAAVGTDQASDLGTAFACMHGQESVIHPREVVRTRLDDLYAQYLSHLDHQVAYSGSHPSGSISPDQTES